MKRIVLASVLVAASAFGAAAQTSAGALSANVEAMILKLVPTADLANLTASQYSRLTATITNPENLKPENNPADQIEVILGAQ